MRARGWWLGSAIALMVLAPWVGGRASAQTPARINGEVLDVSTGKPIRGATVTAATDQGIRGSVTSVSDNKGRFAMLGLRSGVWTVTAVAPGYVPQRGSVQVRAANTNPPVKFQLAKSPEPPPTPLTGVDSKAIADELLKAHALLEASKPDEAIAAYTSLRTKMPELSSVHLQLAYAYRMKKDYAAAVAEYQLVPPTDSEYGLARVEIGRTELERGNTEEGLRVLSDATTGANPEPEAFAAMGDAILARSDAREATQWYEKAIAADPAWASPYLKLGMLAYSQGDTTNAIRYLERAVAMDPKGVQTAQAKALLEKIRH